MKIEPKKQNLKDFGILGNYNVVGTIYILSKKKDIQELEQDISKIVKKSEISIGTSILPDESGIIVRILAMLTEDVFEAVNDTLEVCRKKILNASFSKVRKN